MELKIKDILPKESSKVLSSYKLLKFKNNI